MTLSYTRLLVPLDGSNLAAQALPHAQAITQREHGVIILLHVIPDMDPIATKPAALSAGALEPLDAQVSVHLQTMRRQWHEQAQAMLDAHAMALRQAQLAVQTVLTTGKPADAIIDYAEHEAIDLIVMSTHGRTGFSRWAHGSVAGRVLYVSPCPVLLIGVKHA